MHLKHSIALMCLILFIRKRRFLTHHIQTIFQILNAEMIELFEFHFEQIRCSEFLFQFRFANAQQNNFFLFTLCEEQLYTYTFVNKYANMPISSERFVVSTNSVHYSNSYDFYINHKSSYRNFISAFCNYDDYIMLSSMLKLSFVLAMDFTSNVNSQMLYIYRRV